ncbi:hypothetical protein ACWGDE_27335 [Streptomyces sp. NPDC054956]
MPDTLSPSPATARDIALDHLASGTEALDGVPPMTVTGGPVLPPAGHDEAQVGREAAARNPRPLHLLRTALAQGRTRTVLDLAGRIAHDQQERSSRRTPR